MVDIVKPHDTDAVHFWNCYVSQRKPVLLDGHLMDADWKATAKWDDAYLFKHAGDARVMVEQRDGPGGSYGQGRRVPMAFKDLLQRMREGDDTLYLTTQQVGVSKRDGHPELWAEPLCRLTQDFTPCPSLMGGLVPQQVNLWMGCAKYVLMRGKKRFRLWAPSHASHMHTAGKIVKVHPNGRIVYEGQGDIRADGSSASEVALWEACRSAEAAVQAAEQGPSPSQGAHDAQLVLTPVCTNLHALLQGTAPCNHQSLPPGFRGCT
ncbi:cupin-like domain-containing protein [Dunaliella salina]|uniref:Cupin-like domain-containing protein n=1 Tax=Dunaliella salina TaxID=3046 RepID=A0ABQ7GV63_DUNSA|nr:cupin-like domain-containing protein [Dunaliella salina]|eukprot:KAF5838459.1 cupin-like domain-containing protein [Dunaliella salina]